MLKQQKPWGVKRLLENTFAKDENVTEDSDVYMKHMERKAKLQRRIHHEKEYKKLPSIMVDLKVCSGCVHKTVE